MQGRGVCQSVWHKEETKEPSFRLRVEHLKKLVRWKTRKGNAKLFSKIKADLQQRWIT